MIILQKVKFALHGGRSGGGGGGGVVVGLLFLEGVEIQSQKLNAVLKSKWSINNNKN